jgi:hypothetical protein
MVNTSQTYPKLTLNGKCYTGPKVIFYGRGWYSWRGRGCFRYGNLIDRFSGGRRSKWSRNFTPCHDWCLNSILDSPQIPFFLLKI